MRQNPVQFVEAGVTDHQPAAPAAMFDADAGAQAFGKALFQEAYVGVGVLRSGRLFDPALHPVAG